MKQSNKVMRKKDEYTVSQYNIIKDYTEFVTQFLWNVQQHNQMQQKAVSIQESITNQKDLIDEWVHALKKSSSEELDELKEVQEGRLHQALIQIIPELKEDESE